jgi:hypothetical protein
MICGFDNINDLCCNKYSYQFAATVTDGTRAVALSDNEAPVYRIDNTTAETILLDPSSSLTIDPCSSTEETDIISAWECYQIWRNDCQNIPLDPPVDNYKATQRDIIEKAYKARIDEGYITILSDGIRVTLGITPESQVNLASAALSANIAYSNNNQSVMPTIYDINGQALVLSYEQIADLYKKYTTANAAILSLRSYLLSKIDNADSIEEIVSYIWDLRLIERVVSCPECYQADDFGECLPYTGVPYAPQNLEVSALDSAAYLSWESTVCDGSYPVTNYVIQYSLDYGQSWIDYPTILGNDLFAIVTGLTNELTYIFRVAAVNGAGTGSYSFASSNVFIFGDLLYNKTKLLLSFE